MRFLEDLTEEQKEQYWERLLPNQYHDEDNNLIISKQIHDNEELAINKNYHKRILKENMDLYRQGKSIANEPKRFKDCSLNDYNDEEKYGNGFIQRMCSRAVNGDSFYLMGEFASGKTRLLNAYMKYLYLDLGKRDIQLVHFQELFNGLKMEYGNTTFSNAYEKALLVNTLLIDDVRRFNSKKLNEYDAFVRLLDSRIENDLTTCFTSNISFMTLINEDKDSEANKRVASRIKRILKDRKNLEQFKFEYSTF